MAGLFWGYTVRQWRFSSKIVSIATGREGFTYEGGGEEPLCDQTETAPQSGRGTLPIVRWGKPHAG